LKKGSGEKGKTMILHKMAQKWNLMDEGLEKGPYLRNLESLTLDNSTFLLSGHALREKKKKSAAIERNKEKSASQQSSVHPLFRFKELVGRGAAEREMRGTGRIEVAPSSKTKEGEIPTGEENVSQHKQETAETRKKEGKEKSESFDNRR